LASVVPQRISGKMCNKKKSLHAIPGHLYTAKIAQKPHLKQQIHCKKILV